MNMEDYDMDVKEKSYFDLEQDHWYLHFSLDFEWDYWKGWKECHDIAQ